MLLLTVVVNTQLVSPLARPCLGTGLVGSVWVTMSVIMEKLSNIIPDFREIVDIFNGMLAQHTEDTAHIEDQTKTWVRCCPHYVG